MRTQPGHGTCVFERDGASLGVVNLSGNLFMQAASPAFTTIDEALREVAGADHVLVDMHAEATSEKVAMGWFLDGRVTAVVGTHTHVPTADARVLPGGTAYITDVGMTGARGGVIGVKREQSIAVFRSHMPMRYDASDEDPWLMAVVIRTAPGSRPSRAASIESILRPGEQRDQRRAAGTRRGRGRTSAPARAGARSAPRRRARRRVTGSRRRGTKATATASASAAAERRRCGRARSYRPQTENGEPRSAWKPSVRS